MTRKPRNNTELLSKLAKLEGVVQKLSGLLDPEEAEVAASAGVLPREPRKEVRPQTDTVRTITTAIEIGEDGDVFMSKEFGKLVIGEGRSQYINSTFWASLTAEVWRMPLFLAFTLLYYSTFNG